MYRLIDLSLFCRTLLLIRHEHKTKLQFPCSAQHSLKPAEGLWFNAFYVHNNALLECLHHFDPIFSKSDETCGCCTLSVDYEGFIQQKWEKEAVGCGGLSAALVTKAAELKDRKGLLRYMWHIVYILTAYVHLGRCKTFAHPDSRFKEQKAIVIFFFFLRVALKAVIFSHSTLSGCVLSSSPVEMLL